jgi:hypothetical protein
MGCQVKVLIEREVTTAEAGDIAITAAEGGINYWATVDQYDWQRWCPNNQPDPTEVAEDFVFYTIVGIDEGDLEDFPEARWAVTPLVIRDGIQRYLQGVRRPLEEQEFIDGVPFNGPWAFEPRPFDDMDELAAMDAAEADCVIQLGVFGTLVFG